MPLKLNVGASRKIADDHFGSRGAVINLEIEVDSSLVADSTKLQERIRHLFNVIRQYLAEELNGGNRLRPPLRNSSKQAASPSQSVSGAGFGCCGKPCPCDNRLKRFDCNAVPWLLAGYAFSSWRIYCMLNDNNSAIIDDPRGGTAFAQNGRETLAAATVVCTLAGKPVEKAKST